MEVSHKWLAGDSQLRMYIGWGCPRIYKTWRTGTDKGNRLKFLMNKKSYITRTDWVDSFLEKEFSVQHVKIK